MDISIDIWPTNKTGFWFYPAELHDGPRKISGRNIAGQVARRHGLSLHHLQVKTRRPEIAHIRQEAMFFMRRMTDLSLQQIADVFQIGLHHSTVLHGCRAYERRSNILPESERAAALNLEIKDTYYV